MSDRIEIIPVESASDWQAFLALPRKVYANHPNHVHELRPMVQDELCPQKNPVYKFCEAQAFIARRDGEAVARAVAIFNRNLSERQTTRTGLIGYFEATDEPEAVEAIIERCAKWCAQFRVGQILANVNFSFNYQVGIMTEGYGQPHTFMMPHQPRYYKTLLERCGFQTAKELHAYRVEVGAPASMLACEALGSRARRLKSEGFSVRSMGKQDPERCLRDYNETWKDNYGHTALTPEELDHLHKSMALFLDRRFCLIAEHDGNLAGYLFAFPDFHTTMRGWQGELRARQQLQFFWRHKIARSVQGLKTAIIGVPEAFRGRQVSAILNHELLKRARRHGCAHIERSWILEDNVASIKQATRMGGQLYKSYSIFALPVPQDNHESALPGARQSPAALYSDAQAQAS